MSNKTYLTVMRSLMENGGIGDTIYVVGLFETERKAVIAGTLEKHRRANTPYGGKCRPEIIPMKLNEVHPPIDIQAVEDMYYESSAG